LFSAALESNQCLDTSISRLPSPAFFSCPSQRLLRLSASASCVS
jgi:hypothetical protein